MCEFAVLATLTHETLRTYAPSVGGCGRRLLDDCRPLGADRLERTVRHKLKGSCLPRPLTPQSDGTVPCNVVEAVGNHAADCATYCVSQGRNVTGPPSPQMTAAVQDPLDRTRCLLD